MFTFDDAIRCSINATAEATCPKQNQSHGSILVRLNDCLGVHFYGTPCLYEGLPCYAIRSASPTFQSVLSESLVNEFIDNVVCWRPISVGWQCGSCGREW